MNVASGNSLDKRLLWAAIRFNARILALVCGFLSAFLFVMINLVSVLKWGSEGGEYLRLFGVFFPGYERTIVGILVGSCWAGVYGMVAGASAYRVYGAMLGREIVRSFRETDRTDPLVRPAVLRLHAQGLGVAFGVVAASLLLLTTWLLSIRGDASDIAHAALLVNYLPGYSVSLVGAVLGALVLFLWVFIGAVLLAWLYNTLVALRHG